MKIHGKNERQDKNNNILEARKDLGVVGKCLQRIRKENLRKLLSNLHNRICQSAISCKREWRPGNGTLKNRTLKSLENKKSLKLNDS